MNICNKKQEVSSLPNRLTSSQDTQTLSEAYQNNYVKSCIHLRGINTFSVLRLFVALTVYTKQHYTTMVHI